MFELATGRDEDVFPEGNLRERTAHLDTEFAFVRRPIEDNEEIDITVRAGVAAGLRSEQLDPRGVDGSHARLPDQRPCPPPRDRPLGRLPYSAPRRGPTALVS
jgi:hypothetical protein